MTGLRTVPETLGPDMLGFDRVAEDPPADLDPWVAEHLELLRESAKRGIEALDGDTLCHSDVRADNMLIVEDGTVSFVDWAHASRGSRVAYALQLLFSVDDPHGLLDLNARVDAVLDAHGLPARSARTSWPASSVSSSMPPAGLSTRPCRPSASTGAPSGMPNSRC